MKIKDLPDLERPYEKLESYGVSNLSNAELLAIIIKTGTKELTSVQIAQQILAKDVNKLGISFLKDISIEEMQQIKGIGRVKAIQLKAVLELSKRIAMPINIKYQKVITPEHVSEIVMSDLKDQKQEIIKTLLLNNKNNLIRIVTNSIGGLNSNIIEPREIFKEPIKASAAKIILVHNHPSGDPTPSRSDIDFTKRICVLADMLGIELLDHIIIGDNNFYSLKRENKF